MSTTPSEGTTSAARADISATDLAGQAPVRRIHGRNRTKADILVYRWRGRTIAVKDYGVCAWPLRQTLGRFLTRRETAAYRAAEGVDGLPRFLGRLGPFSLATEWVDGRTLSEFADGVVRRKVFDRLEAILRALHERGVAVGDLHHRDVLVDQENRVRLIDLAMAWVRGTDPGRFRRRLFEHFRDTDLWGLARMRARFTGDGGDVKREDRGSGAVKWHRRARSIKWYWDRLRGAPRLPRNGP